MIVTVEFILTKIHNIKFTSDEEDPFIYVGKSKVLYNEAEMTFHEAKEACAKVGSGLVEFWDEQDWGQVRSNSTFSLK